MTPRVGSAGLGQSGRPTRRQKLAAALATDSVDSDAMFASASGKEGGGQAIVPKRAHDHNRLSGRKGHENFACLSITYMRYILSKCALTSPTVVN